MVHTYQLDGMTCAKCEEKVKSALLDVEHVSEVEVSKDESTATVTMDEHVDLPVLRGALESAGDQYRISAKEHNEAAEQGKSWLATYKPILLIFGYITAATLLVQAGNESFDLMQWMRHFMAGFFLTFSFFKIMDLKGFAQNYVAYDIIARRFPAWAYVYAFTELALGLAFLTGFNPVLTNAVTFAVMSVSIVGVLRTVLDKKQIQCACLGTIFDFPMSTVTIIEDAMMIAMSGSMLYFLLG